MLVPFHTTAGQTIPKVSGLKQQQTLLVLSDCVGWPHSSDSHWGPSGPSDHVTVRQECPEEVSRGLAALVGWLGHVLLPQACVA